MQGRKWAIALQALILTGAYAQDCSYSTTITVVSSTPSALASCTAFTGDIAIASSFSGEMDFSGVKTIAETVYATDVANLEGLDMYDLENLNGLEISYAPNFSYISWGGDADYASIKTLSWTSVDGILELDLQNFAGDSAVSLDSCQGLETFNISSPKPNSGLTSLSVTKNPKLGSLLIPNWEVEKSIEINENGMMQAVDLPYMTRVGEYVIIRGNANLTSVALPSMTAIGGDFRISADHNVFVNVSNSALQSIGGDIIFEGDVMWGFDPEMTLNGSFIISYSDLDGDQFTCQDGDINPGKFTITCNGQIISPTYQTATSSATAGRGANAAASSRVAAYPSSSSSGLTTGAKIGIGIGVSLGAIGTISIIVTVVLLLRLRKKRAAAAYVQTGTELEEGKLPPPYSSGLWGCRSDKKNHSRSDGSHGSAEPMFPDRQDHQGGGGTAELEGDQRLNASAAQMAELESPRPERESFIPPVEMEGDQNWRRSELMGDTPKQD